MKIVNQNGRETTSLSATNAKQNSKYHEKEISIIKQMVSASLSGVSASHMVADPYGCWNVAKRFVFVISKYIFIQSV